MSTPAMLRAVNAVAAWVTPELPARLARGLLLQPRPHRPQPWEHRAAANARRVTFRFGLSGLRWGDAGPTVLMVHGWEGRPTQFRYVVEPLVASGRQVVALDGPAHGGSLGEESSLMEFAMAIREAAVELPGLEAVVGHSLGAAATAIALAGGLRADRAVLIAPPSDIEASLRGFARHVGLDEGASARFVDLVGRANGVPARDLEISRLVRSLSIPALVVHDADDTAVPFEDGAAIAHAWPGARLLATTGLGHWKLLADPSVTHGVAEFLVGHDAGLTSAQLRAVAAR